MRNISRFFHVSWRRILQLSLMSILPSCAGYHVEGQRYFSDRPTITVPYVEGDLGGQLTDELIRQLTVSGGFQCVKEGGHYLLKVRVLSTDREKIGYRYDRDDVSGKLRKNLYATEERGTMAVEVTLIEATSEKIVVGPATVEADADYDYVDASSLRDLSFINEEGKRETVIKFSLGQLDTIEGAQDDANVPLFKHLAYKIVSGIIHNRS